MEKNLYDYEIKKGKDILFNFAFIKLDEKLRGEELEVQ